MQPLSLFQEHIDPGSMLTLTLPWPPSVNHYWRHAARGGRVVTYVSSGGKAYKTAVAAAVRRQAPGHRAYTGTLAVRVLLYPPTRRAYDADNRLKGLFDALTEAGVWQDDKLPKDIFVGKREPCPPRGCVTVSIGQLGV